MPSVVFIPRRDDRLQSSVRHVQKRGFKTLGFPLLVTTPKQVQIPITTKGIILTSSAALKALPLTNLPLYCVGEATAQAAQKAGFHVAYAGAGNGAELADFLTKILLPQPLLHPTTKDAEIKWYTTLKTKGFSIISATAYEKKYADHFNAEVVCCLTENKVSFTLVFSAQAARHLKHLCQAHHLSEKTLGTVIAISEHAAAPFRELNNVQVAQHPNLQEMLNVLEQTTQQN